jgi:hypothetical protein
MVDQLITKPLPADLQSGIRFVVCLFNDFNQVGDDYELQFQNDVKRSGRGLFCGTE